MVTAKCCFTYTTHMHTTARPGFHTFRPIVQPVAFTSATGGEWLAPIKEAGFIMGCQEVTWKFGWPLSRPPSSVSSPIISDRAYSYVFNQHSTNYIGTLNHSMKLLMP